MLSDADKLLLAAALDGSVPPDQATALARLLAGSAAARALAAELTTDCRRLAGLPRLTAPAGFAARVDLALPIIRPTHPLPDRRRPAWLPYATAAGVFVGITALAYQFADRPARPGLPPVAKAPPRPKQPITAPGPNPDQEPTPQPADEPAVVADRHTPPPHELAPTPRPATAPDLLAAGLLREIEPPAEVAARLPLLGPVGDLDSVRGQTQVQAIWATPAGRLDLFVPDLGTAVPAVLAVARSCGWAVGTDPAAQALLKAKQPGTFALYADAVTADEGRKFLAGLAAQQRDGTKLGTAHLSAAGTTDLREMRELFGGDPRPAAREAKDDSTIGQVVKQLTPRRPALLFALAPSAARPPVASKEVRAFADSRGERGPDAIPLLVVIRATD